MQDHHYTTTGAMGKLKYALTVQRVTMKKCYETNAEIHMSLLQIKSTLLSPGLLNLVMLLFNRLARGLLPRFSRPPIMCYNDVTNHTALKKNM